MIQIRIISPGKHKENWLIEALGEYEKRLSHTVRLEWVLPRKEEEIEKFLEGTPYTLLDPQGKMFTSEEFSEHLYTSSRHTILIGGASGVSDAIKARALHKISLSRLTFTHQLTRLVLLEQIYRSIEIHKGSSYHK